MFNPYINQLYVWCFCHSKTRSLYLKTPQANVGTWASLWIFGCWQSWGWNLVTKFPKVGIFEPSMIHVYLTWPSRLSGYKTLICDTHGGCLPVDMCIEFLGSKTSWSVFASGTEAWTLADAPFLVTFTAPKWLGQEKILICQMFLCHWVSTKNNLRFWKLLLPAHFALLETWISWVEPGQPRN